MFFLVGRKKKGKKFDAVGPRKEKKNRVAPPSEKGAPRLKEKKKCRPMRSRGKAPIFLHVLTKKKRCTITRLGR